MRPIKAICFDFWGTLVEVSGRKQINDLKQILGAGIIDDKSFLKQVELSLLTRPWPLKKGIKDLAEKLKITVDKSTIDKACQSWWSYVEKSKPFPESEDVLDKLNRRGIILIIISNTDREAFDYKIKTLGWKKYFKKFFLSCDLGVLKPNIKIFKEAERFLNIPKQNILMIDDSLPHGITPTKKLSWQTFWINDKKRTMIPIYQLID